MLYLRQLLVLAVSLYTVRVVLEVLGVEDYGIYTVIGGVVSFFSFLSGSMASATQRFFSFAMGQKDSEKLKKTFTVNLIIYLAIAVIALLFLETIGLWFVNNHLRLPAEKFETARWIYHFSVATFVATIITTPLTSIIIAHEDMHIYAYMSIIETILKLLTVLLLIYVSFEKLKLYTILLLAVSLINLACYWAICIRRYKECQFRQFFWDKIIFKEVVGFTGWTLFGQVTTVGRNQAITILVNQFFNPVVVAARAIAVNITSQINVFSNNFNTGLYPPLIKSYAAGNRKEMFSLLFNGSRITFFLMWVFALPFYLEMDSILKIWLKDPPEYSVLFTRLALIEALIMSVSLPIATAARAPGKMKIYELTLGSIQIGIFMASWIVLKMGGSAASVFVVAIIANLLMLIVRLIIVRALIALPLLPFFKEVLFPVSLTLAASASLSCLIKISLPGGYFYSCIVVFCSICSATLCMYFIGLSKELRERFREMIKSRGLKMIKSRFA